ncbi:MAG: hypothetical protein IE926_01910 [Micrococcales bacterium]|nr:hypothetical protein [Micrococcales bacterium]
MTEEQLASQLARRFAVEVRDPSATPTVVTATAAMSTDNITKTAHGLSVGDQVQFDGTPAAPLATGTTYYVVNVTANTFKVSATEGGTPVDISADGDANYIAIANWTRVRAISDFKPTKDYKTEDDSDYDSEGWQSESKTGMGWGLEIDLIRKIGITTRAEDPGQQIIRVKADEFPPDDLLEVRWFDRNGGEEAFQGYVSPQWEDQGGPNTALDKAKAKLMGQGKRNVITNPYPTGLVV